MENLYYKSEDELVTESDVEQKIIYPLLTNHTPIGLGYDSKNILTKHSLKKILIGKGDSKKLYYPDFVINFNGVPSLIIEAKRPKENLIEAYREAALYASEVNRHFETDVNPVKFIMASDGMKVIYGYADSHPLKEISTEDFIIGSVDYEEFIELFEFQNIKKYSEEVVKKIRKTNRFYKPIFLLGGKFIQNKQTRNTFGDNISIQYRHLFNPIADGEMEDVVRNAYVTVHKHESHISPIDKLIRKKLFLR